MMRDFALQLFVLVISINLAAADQQKFSAQTIVQAALDDNEEIYLTVLMDSVYIKLEKFIKEKKIENPKEQLAFLKTMREIIGNIHHAAILQFWSKPWDNAWCAETTKSWDPFWDEHSNEVRDEVWEVVSPLTMVNARAEANAAAQRAVNHGPWNGVDDETCRSCVAPMEWEERGPYCDLDSIWSAIMIYAGSDAGRAAQKFSCAAWQASAEKLKKQGDHEGYVFKINFLRHRDHFCQVGRLAHRVDEWKVITGFLEHSDEILELTFDKNLHSMPIALRKNPFACSGRWPSFRKKYFSNLSVEAACFLSPWLKVLDEFDLMRQKKFWHGRYDGTCIISFLPDELIFKILIVMRKKVRASTRK